MTTFLPATMTERIRDLMDQNHISQSELAAKLNMTDSALSRFLNGKTSKISDDAILKLAEIFCVSTDFLYGTTEIPDRMNYDIAELGLSSLAAKNLYTKQANPEVVCRLLENPRFALLTYMVSRYFNDTMAAGIAAQNQMLESFSSILLGQGAAEAARDVKLLRTPVYQMELANIEEIFMRTIQEIKRDIGSQVKPAQDLTKEMIQSMYGNLTKGENVPLRYVTPEQVADQITDTLKHTGADNKTIKRLNRDLVEVFRSMPRPYAAANT